MIHILKQAMVVARRDFMAVVATPTFLIFLFAPLLMLGLGLLSGTGAAYVATASNDNAARIVAIAPPPLGGELSQADAAARQIFRDYEAPPPLLVLAPQADVAAQIEALFKSDKYEVTAVMSGKLNSPQIAHQPISDRHARYLAALAEDVSRAQASGIALDKKQVQPQFMKRKVDAPRASSKQASGFGAVIVIFMLTLMLASQAVGMLAEEKSNKVIEILAAALPLEAVFLGKLIGMFGVAVLFVAFWASLAGIVVALAPADMVMNGFAPAIGLPMFMVLCGAYFSMAFMLLGAVFLGFGAQAATMREIQMMSLPITIFQMAMLGLSSAAAGTPGSTIALVAELFPFSSPFAMAARAATDAAIWPHILALMWQALWVAITIWVSVRLFRIGVLKSGGGFRNILGIMRGVKA